jgi:hypothetical protein
MSAFGEVSSPDPQPTSGWVIRGIQFVLLFGQTFPDFLELLPVQQGRGPAGILEDIGQDQRLEIATALTHGLTLVDPWAPFHDQMREMGMDKFIESLR